MTKSRDTSNEFELPKTYGDTKVFILPKDPIWIFAYWEISPIKFEEFSKQYKNDFDSSAFVIRVYDVTDIDFNGCNANKFFDIYISYDSLSWYINVGEYNRSFVVEIGFMLKNGKFISVVRSNFLTMPSYSVSDVRDELRRTLKFDFEKLLKKNNVTSSITVKNVKEF
ncbi:MAG: DUF4912 domain-containing protein [Endomicrobium sp.]|jgi:hypothetical protein|nr:DUF4912 domain-containing protein [Endomicrobium sp.]